MLLGESLLLGEVEVVVRCERCWGHVRSVQAHLGVLRMHTCRGAVKNSLGVDFLLL